MFWNKIGHCLILRRIIKNKLAFRIKNKRLLALRKITQVPEKNNKSALQI
jgi:hypothetical protein